MSFVFPPPAPPAVAIVGRTERFPVHRIYCVGRNYAAHAREMGKDPEREARSSSPSPPTRSSPTARDCRSRRAPPICITRSSWWSPIGTGGANIGISQALSHVFGYGVGIDLTRRDLQAEAKDKGRPWDTAKGFDRSAPISAHHAGRRRQAR